MVWGSEKDITKRGRIVIVAVLWAVGIPLFVGLWLLSWWIALIGIAACAWGTWDYVKKGGLFAQVDSAFIAEQHIARQYDQDE
jgi:hypothetical protein